MTERAVWLKAKKKKQNITEDNRTCTQKKVFKKWMVDQSSLENCQHKTPHDQQTYNKQNENLS